MLEGVNVALGVTGSIAAVKVVELAHELRRQGAAVRGLMSQSAAGVIHPWAVQFATENPVVTELTGDVEHIALCGEDGWADVFLIAPATANTIGKMAAAIDDTPVTTCATTAIGAGLPVVVAPAMHAPMADHPGVVDAMDRLESWGVPIVDPELAEGKAKLAAEAALVVETARAVDDGRLDGVSVAVTSGATTEPIDPLRTLTNRSSGKTGRAVARACYVQGADVTLLHNGGPVPYGDVRSIETAAELVEAASDAADGADALISAAAIADYRVDDPAEEKIRSGQELSIDLTPAPKLLDAVRDANPDLPLVGFKAETTGDDAMTASARELLDRVDCAFVVANDASVMGEDRTETLFVTPDEVTRFAGSKADLGFAVAERLANVLE
jgi:phosphopantothenoylcysteine decarboxylase/phosphopantothenate--cysteine ligase